MSGVRVRTNVATFGVFSTRAVPRPVPAVRTALGPSVVVHWTRAALTTTTGVLLAALPTTGAYISRERAE